MESPSQHSPARAAPAAVATEAPPALEAAHDSSAGAPAPVTETPTRDAAADASSTGAAVAPREGSVAVEMSGFKHARGQVLVALWRTSRGFPDEGRRAFGKAQTKVARGKATVVFEGVPPGPFAVVAHHDEDRDFEMDTGLMGIPSEGYGFSRNASGSFGPPSFEDARLWLAAGKERHVRIRMRY